MFKNAYRLPFRLMGIPVYLDVTFLIILPLFAWLIGRQIGMFVELAALPIDAGPLTLGALPYALGAMAALGLFASVVIHELGHALTARRWNVETERITLWLLGGMAHFRNIPEQRGAEAIVAIAGPITSFALALMGWAALQVIPAQWGGLYFVVAYVAFMNVILATFNLLPALPLDGGRVLRSLLALRMERVRATQVAVSVSKFLAVMLGIVGIMGFNLFFILIAVFIYLAVQAELNQTVMTRAFEQVRVGDLMTRQVVTVTPEMPIGELVARMFREAYVGYPVVDPQGTVVGVVDLGDTRGAQDNVPVAQIMRRDFAAVPPEASAMQAFEIMASKGLERLVVLDRARNMVGLVTRTDFMRAMQVHMARLAPADGPTARPVHA